MVSDDLHLQDGPVHTTHPDTNTGRDVGSDNLPCAIVHADLADAVDDGGVQREDPVDVLVSASVEGRLIARDGVAAQVTAPGQGR